MFTTFSCHLRCFTVQQPQHPSTVTWKMGEDELPGADNTLCLPTILVCPRNMDREYNNIMVDDDDDNDNDDDDNIIIIMEDDGR